jgi:hypothetical protein
MPVPDFESYKVTNLELSSPAKFGNFVQAVEDEFSDIDADQISGYPSDATRVLRGDGSWPIPSGYLFSYDEFTAPVSITATTEGSANTIVTAGSVTYDGTTAVRVEFGCVRLDKGSTETQLWLYDNGVSIGMIGRTPNTCAVMVACRLTPSNAAHVYSIRGAVDGGTGFAQAGVGGAGVMMPGFIRVTKA